MSPSEKSDVKNHLSARHRTEIHLAPRASQPDAGGILDQEFANADSKKVGSVHTPVSVATPIAAKDNSAILSKSPQGISK
jgi:hypothetical protein